MLGIGVEQLRRRTAQVRLLFRSSSSWDFPLSSSASALPPAPSADSPPGALLAPVAGALIILGLHLLGA
jgi:hypothetical protein